MKCFGPGLPQGEPHNGDDECGTARQYSCYRRVVLCGARVRRSGAVGYAADAGEGEGEARDAPRGAEGDAAGDVHHGDEFPEYMAIMPMLCLAIMAFKRGNKPDKADEGEEPHNVG